MALLTQNGKRTEDVYTLGEVLVLCVFLPGDTKYVSDASDMYVVEASLP